MAQICRDIYSVMEQSRRWKKLVTVRSAVANKFIQRGGDVVAGYTMQVQLDIKDAVCLASIPLDDYDFEQELPDPVTCADGLIFNSDEVQIGTVVSGGSITITDSNVSNSDDSFSQNILAQEDLELDDITVTAKNSEDTTLIANIAQPSAVDAELTVPDITVTDSDGSSSSYPAGKDFTCQPDTGSVGKKILKTGQTISYRTGDDGDLEKGRQTNFTTLPSNNPFGNTNRFTDTLGGQTYANDWVIDWSTYDGSEALGYYRAELNNVDFDGAVDACVAGTFGTYSDCRLANFNEMFNIWDKELTSLMAYSPFNHGTGFRRYWSSTTYLKNTTRAHAFQQSGVTVAVLAKTTLSTFDYYVPVREFTNADLGL